MILSLNKAALCPTSVEIKQLTNFHEVQTQMPFPDYPGVKIFNGISYQKKGICNITGALCTKGSCIGSQECRMLSKELVFNMISTNPSIDLTAKNISYAVKTAKNISYLGFFYPSHYIPDILCMYNISGLLPEYSCLPKFCKGVVCMSSNKTCRCLYEPCQLYYAVEYK